MQQETFKYDLEIEEHWNEYDHHFTTLENVIPISVSCECPHCNVFSSMSIDSQVQRLGWTFDFLTHCPHCNESVFVQAQYNEEEDNGKIIAIHPNSQQKVSIPKEVPDKYSKDFKEAILVLKISPKASAALCRRILQNILREDYNIKKGNLAEEIDKFIALGNVPSYLTDAVDAVRNIGNIAAHPLKDTNTGEITEVEPGEAEWLIEVLESLFDFTFIQPQKLATRRKELNQKLQRLGKSQLKS